MTAERKSATRGVKAPANLNGSGLRLWRNMTKSYVFGPHELDLLEQACRTSELIESMQGAIDKLDGDYFTIGHAGQPVITPLVAEIRQHRNVLARLLNSLKLPEEQAADRSTNARKAAAARWGNPRGATG